MIDDSKSRLVYKQIIHKVGRSVAADIKMPTTKVVIISQPFYPDSQATSQLLSALAQSLSHPTERAHAPLHITVLCSQPSSARGDDREDQVPRYEHWENVEIYRGGWSIDAKRSLSHRALSYGSFLMWLMWRLIFKTTSDDHILVVTNPPFAPMITWLCAKLKRLFGSKLKYSVILHDLYPDGLIALGKLSAHSWWIKLWRRVNRYTLQSSEAVITLGRDMSAYCRDVYQLSDRHCKVITNWSPVNFDEIPLVEPQQTELWRSLPSEVRRADPLLIQYSGNMGLWHNIDGIVEAAKLLEDLPIHFLMIGDGRRKAEAMRYAKELELLNMTWLPFQPLDQLTDSLQCAHLSLVSQRDELLGIMVPSKFYGILASGRGVIAQVPKNSEVALTIEESQCGLVLYKQTPQHLAQCIRAVYPQRARIKKMGQAAHHIYSNIYSFHRAVESFYNHLTDQMK